MTTANYGATADIVSTSQPPTEEVAALEAAEAKMEEGQNLCHDAKTKTPEEKEEEWDSTLYDMTKLSSWISLTMKKGSALENYSVWISVTRSFAVACIVALVTYLTPYADVIDSERLLKLGALLTVFVGFLLGFYISSSMTRWYACTVSFMELLDAVRKMQMQMTALGVAKELSETISRYGLLSAWLLYLNLHMYTVKNPGDGMGEKTNLNDKESIDTLWKQLDGFRPDIVRPHEKKILMGYPESYALVWTWVASLVGRMARDGDIPPMASPTYGRILDIVQQAYASIRGARAPFLIRAPFVYVHTMSILVHVNTLLNAVVLGVQLGLTIPYFISTTRRVGRMELAKVHLPDSCADLFVAFCLNLVAPILYLTLLDASTCMAQPFTFKDAKIPFQRFIKVLESDLKSAKSIADEPPLWEKPAFKK